ncbi:MAG: NAD(P)H-binding protein [Anaerolineales bacterium]|nr:NAD(P)H-binding protein [Anaerolineales bacterium]
MTGGTGFIGRALVRHLVDAGYRVRTLIRPSKHSPRLPSGIPIDVAVAGLNDERGLRAAMVGVKTIYHLAGVERRGAGADLLEVDIQGTRNMIRAASDAGVDRFFFTSHLGADRASAFPLLKAKAIAEENLRRSGLDYTIFRTALVFGPNDGFTSGLAQLLSAIPGVFLIPGEGDNLVQPLWIEDLTTCLTWALDDADTRKRTYEIGGPEFLTLEEVVKKVIAKVGVKRSLVTVSPPVLRALTVMIEYALPSSPVSVYWLDYLSTNRTCSLDTIPRVFNLMPSRFSQRLDYLGGQNWRRTLWQSIFKRRN